MTPPTQPFSASPPVATAPVALLPPSSSSVAVAAPTPEVAPQDNNIDDLKNIEDLMAGLTTELTTDMNPWAGLL